MDASDSRASDFPVFPYMWSVYGLWALALVSDSRALYSSESWTLGLLWELDGSTLGWGLDGWTLGWGLDGWLFRLFCGFRPLDCRTAGPLDGWTPGLHPGLDPGLLVVSPVLRVLNPGLHPGLHPGLLVVSPVLRVSNPGLLDRRIELISGKTGEC